jgi:hypothetical protein
LDNNNNNFGQNIIRSKSEKEEIEEHSARMDEEIKVAENKSLVYIVEADPIATSFRQQSFSKSFSKSTTNMQISYSNALGNSIYAPKRLLGSFEVFGLFLMLSFLIGC